MEKEIVYRNGFDAFYAIVTWMQSELMGYCYPKHLDYAFGYNVSSVNLVEFSVMSRTTGELHTITLHHQDDVISTCIDGDLTDVSHCGLVNKGFSEVVSETAQALDKLFYRFVKTS